jgi:hypothetical protein
MPGSFFFDADAAITGVAVLALVASVGGVRRDNAFDSPSVGENRVLEVGGGGAGRLGVPALGGVERKTFIATAPGRRAGNAVLLVFVLASICFIARTMCERHLLSSA